MKDIDYMIVPIKIKSIEKKEDEGFIYVEGYAAIYNNIDLGGDRILSGAFAEDLKENGNQRPALWQHFWFEPVGTKTYAENEKGLTFLAKLPMDDTFVMGRVYPQLRVGSVKGASIGYRTLDDRYNEQMGCRDLIKLCLKESSFVTFPMNEEAQIFSVRRSLKNIQDNECKEMSSSMKNFIIDFAKKSHIDDSEILKDSKTVPAYKDYSLTDEKLKWDKKKAIKQIRANTNSQESPSKSYKKGFMYFDPEKEDDFTGYKLPYVYYDGGFKAVPRGLFAITGALSGARGGVNILDTDKAKIKSQLNKYYKKMGREEPFKGDKTFIDVGTLECMEKRDIEKIFDNDIILSTQSKRLIADRLGYQDNDNLDDQKSDFLIELEGIKDSINKL